MNDEGCEADRRLWRLSDGRQLAELAGHQGRGVWRTRAAGGPSPSPCLARLPLPIPLPLFAFSPPLNYCTQPEPLHSARSTSTSCSAYKYPCHHYTRLDDFRQSPCVRMSLVLNNFITQKRSTLRHITLFKKTVAGAPFKENSLPASCTLKVFMNHRLYVCLIHTSLPAGGLIASGGADSCIKLWPLSDWVPPPAPAPAGASDGSGPLRGGSAVQRWRLDHPQHLLRAAPQPAAGGLNRCT